MTDSFDPYLKWLGIRDPERPPNHYRLLGIDLYESDPDVIATAADRQMAHVRRYQSGSHAQASQDLLNELAAAKLLLLSPEKKTQYDRTLGKPGSSQRGGALPIAGWGVAAAAVICTILIGVRLFTTGDDGGAQPTITTASENDVESEPAAAKDPPQVDHATSDAPTDHPADGRSDLAQATNGNNSDDVITQHGDAPDLTDANSSEVDTASARSETVDVTVLEPDNEAPAPPQHTTPAPWHSSFGEGPYPYPAAESIWYDIKLAISSGDLVGAENDLASIRRQAGASNNDSIYLGLAKIVDALQRFDVAVQHGWKNKVTPGTPLMWGETPVEFRGSDTDEIYIAASNELKTFSTDTWAMPAQLAATFASLGMPETQSTRLVLGTFWAFNQHGDVATADEHWQHARRMSSDEVELMLASWTSDATSLRQPDQRGQAPLAAIPPKAQLASAWNEIQLELGLPRSTTNALQMRESASRLTRRAKNENDTCVKYVCLAHARDYATRSNDVTTALDAIKEIRAAYDVPAAELRSWLTELQWMTTERGQMTSIAEVAIDAARARIDEDQYDGVEALLNVAIKSARTEDASLAETAKQLQKNVRVYSRYYRKVSLAREVLAKTPDDPEANTAYGQFLCYTKGDFARGLPYLAKSHDYSLRKLARRSHLPTQPTAQAEIEIADGWWAIAQEGEITDFQRANIKNYARNIWYRPAVARPSVTAQQRQHIQARLRSS